MRVTQYMVEHLGCSVATVKAATDILSWTFASVAFHLKTYRFYYSATNCCYLNVSAMLVNLLSQFVYSHLPLAYIRMLVIWTLTGCFLFRHSSHFAVCYRCVSTISIGCALLHQRDILRLRTCSLGCKFSKSWNIYVITKAWQLTVIRN